MKLVKVNIEKFKVIENLEKTIDGKNILIVGDNQVGKSSLLQFIQIALGQQSDLPTGIEEGKGTIWVDKEGRNWEFSVEFKKGKPIITVLSPDGVKDNRKSVLATIVGAIDFDINEFVNQSETAPGRKKQVETYLSLLPAEVQQFIQEQNVRVERFYNERAELNKEAKNLEGALAEHEYKKIGPDIPEKKIDPSEVQAKIDEGLAINNKIVAGKQKRDGYASEMESIKAQIATLQEKLTLVTQSHSAAEKWLSEQKEVDLSGLMKQKDEAYELNRLFDIKVDYLKKKGQLEAVKNDSGERSALIDSSRQAISDAIKDCDSPVDGLSFDSEGLIYNGTPVTSHNLSSSEIMHLGVKLKMAENPDLGMLFIQRGESLGSQRLNDIKDLASKYGWQVIMEEVRRGEEKLKIEIMGE